MIQPPIVSHHVVAALVVTFGATVFMLAGLAVVALAAGYLKRRYDVD